MGASQPLLTAETVTDEMVRELQRSIAGRVFSASGMAHTGLSDVWHTCQVALGDVLFDDIGRIQSMRAARAECARILNSRTGGSK